MLRRFLIGLAIAIALLILLPGIIIVGHEVLDLLSNNINPFSSSVPTD